MNRTANCDEWQTPTTQDVLEDLGDLKLAVLTTSCFLCFVSVFLFIVQMTKIAHSHLRTRTVTRLGYVLAVFPVTAMSSLVVLLVPRAQPMMDVMIYTYYARWLFGYIELVAVDMYGNRTLMKDKLSDVPIKMDKMPFTCFCGPCIPMQVTTGRILHRIEWLIWQNGVVRCVVAIVIGAITSNNIGSASSLLVVNIVAALTISLSCAIAMWAINVYANVVGKHLTTYRVHAQFRIVQLLVLMFNMQSNLFKLLGSHLAVMECSTVFSRLDLAVRYYHIALIVEMSICSVLVTWMFRSENNALLQRSTNSFVNYSIDNEVNFRRTDTTMKSTKLATIA